MKNSPTRKRNFVTPSSVRLRPRRNALTTSSWPSSTPRAARRTRDPRCPSRVTVYRARPMTGRRRHSVRASTNLSAATRARADTRFLPVFAHFTTWSFRYFLITLNTSNTNDEVRFCRSIRSRRSSLQTGSGGSRKDVGQRSSRRSHHVKHPRTRYVEFWHHI